MDAPRSAGGRRAAAVDFGADLHPILRRVYAARGLSRREDLDLSLERLLPVSSLERRRGGGAICSPRTGAPAGCW